MTNMDGGPLRSDRLLQGWVARLGQELADIERQVRDAEAGSDPSSRQACRVRIDTTRAALAGDYRAAIAARPPRPLGRRGIAGYRRWRHGRRMMRFRLVVRQALEELDRMSAALGTDDVEFSAAADRTQVP